MLLLFVLYILVGDGVRDGSVYACSCFCFCHFYFILLIISSSALTVYEARMSKCVAQKC